MDIIKGLDLKGFQTKALHTPNSPQTVYTSKENSLFERIEARNNNLINDFAERRGGLTKVSTGAGYGGDIYAALPRTYSPEDYFNQTQIPWNINDDKERFKLYKWLDLFYRTHYLIPILVDIFTRFPLVGLELESNDDQLKEFYEDLFFDRLDYEQFLVDLGREYWTLGQSFPLGHFNETLGIWEEEELLDPTLIKVRQYPIIGGQQFFLTPDDTLKGIVKKQQPKEMFYLLQRDYPEMIPFIMQDKDIPISDVLLRQVAFKVSRRDVHGTPILLRCLRTLIHEEKLMASQDAIAERLYSPLIMVKLGIQDMGQDRGPWLPTPVETAMVRNEFEMALMSDFRLMVHHFGIEVNNVFGREQMPRLGDDFDRIERRLMQTFGINPSLLSGGAASQPYASSALQAEFLNQILRTYQGFLKKHYEYRAKVVAEAQEHWDYEKRGDRRIPIMEEVLEYDEDGNEVIVEKHKLKIPELKMKVLDLRDEATQRQYLQSLKQQGVPIPDSMLAMGMGYNFPDALSRTEEELIQKTVTTQEAKVKTYNILAARGLPIPPDLKQEVEGAEGFVPPEPGSNTNLSVTPPGIGEDIPMPPPPGGTPAIGPRNPERGDRPEESDERSPIPPPGQVPNPTIPGVPGQPGMLGIPGAPKPAIPTTSSVDDTPIIRKLPRKASTNFSIDLLRILDESDTLPEVTDETSENSE